MAKLKLILKYILIYTVPTKLIMWRGSKNARQIALTFDDGPNPETTPKLLEALKKIDARATFFVVGENVKKYPDIVQKVKDAGHEIGNHSYSHRRMTELSRKSLVNEIDDTAQCLSEFGSRCNLYRPPYGVIRYGYLPTIWRLKQSIVMWSIDTRDFESTSAEEVTKRITKVGLRGGDILLMHDDAKVSYEVVLWLGKQAVKQGMKFVSVSELMASY